MPLWIYLGYKEWALREGKVGTVLERSRQKLVHFIGKDNIVHCIIFPAMLKAEGSYILPDNVPANEFLNLEGNKLSTSKIGRFGCTNIWRFPRSARCFALRIDI
jgi:methionyl-tRNA synthetase